MKTRRRSGYSGARAALGVLACAMIACAPQSAVPSAAEGVLCPELAGNVDLLQLSFSSDPDANGRIRAFTSAARGLYDVALEMHRLAGDACRRMAHDLGQPEAPADAPLDVLCQPLRDSLARVAAGGIEVRISIAAPHCASDAERQSRCGAACASTECATLCRAEGELYARCSMPSIAVAASSTSPELTRLSRTLEENLPPLLYAEMALGKRLVAHAEALVAASARLPEDVKASGEHGVACTAIAATLTANAAASLRAVVNASAATTALLNPEVHEVAR